MIEREKTGQCNGYYVPILQDFFFRIVRQSQKETDNIEGDGLYRWDRFYRQIGVLPYRRETDSIVRYCIVIQYRYIRFIILSDSIDERHTVSK